MCRGGRIGNGGIMLGGRLVGGAILFHFSMR